MTTDVYERQMHDADALVARIIQSNLPGAARAQSAQPTASR